MSWDEETYGVMTSRDELISFFEETCDMHNDWRDPYEMSDEDLIDYWDTYHNDDYDYYDDGYDSYDDWN